MVNTEIRLIIFFAAKDGDLYTVSKNKTRSWLWLRSRKPLLPNSDLNKKVGKTTRPFRYDLNQPLKIMQWKWQTESKGLDLIDRMPEELQTEVCDIIQESVTNTIPKEKEMQKGKMVAEGAL